MMMAFVIVMIMMMIMMMKTMEMVMMIITNIFKLNITMPTVSTCRLGSCRMLAY